MEKKTLKVSLLAEEGSEGWMTKAMGSGEGRQERYKGGKVKRRESERERKCGVISYATEPHSRHRGNSR